MATVNVRIDDDLYAAVKQMAQTHSRSLVKEVNHHLRRACESAGLVSAPIEAGTMPRLICPKCQKPVIAWGPHVRCVWCAENFSRTV